MKRFAGIVLLRLWLASSFFFLVVLGSAQDIPIGTWRTHFSYSHARFLERTTDKVFCAVESGLYSIELTERSIRKLSKIDGLSDVEVSAMKYNEDLNVLALGYASGFVDLVFEDRIVSIEEIANSDLEGDKRVNSIRFFGDQVLCATGLGIVAANATSGEIRENFVQIGVDGAEETAVQLEILGGQLFARTLSGIQSGNLNSNLLDFNNWTHYPNTEALSDLVTSGNDVYALSDQDLFQLVGDIWTDTNLDLPATASRLLAHDEIIYTATSSAIFRLNDTQFETASEMPSTMANDLLVVAGEFWLADETMGLISSAGGVLSPDGPLLNEFSNLKVINSTLYAFHAPPTSTYSGSQKVAGFSVFENGTWRSQAIPSFQNVSDVVSFQGSLYFSSIGDGLFSESADEILEDIPGSDAELDTMLNAIASRQNLWLSSYANANAIHSFDGTNWTSYPSATLLGDQVDEIALSETEILWYRRNGSVFVFDPETQNVLPLSGLPGAATGIEISLNDDPWVATNDGPVNFSDGSFIFSSNAAILPSFENRTLFEGEQINAIETDGGGRVWFATNRGLWIFDRSISNLEALFNISNSPLPSDRVTDLAYDSNNGEMFILTNKGLISYRSASSNPSARHNNVQVFPNPVLPEYAGLVGIEGLAKNVSVKITDINGHLVKELSVNGGSASWDLRNVANGEVVTGVYLIFSSSPDGTETFVGKIAVVR